VLEDESGSLGRPIPGVRVVLDGGEHETVTNSRGRFEFTSIEVGVHQLRLERAGFVTLDTWVGVVPGHCPSWEHCHGPDDITLTMSPLNPG